MTKNLMLGAVLAFAAALATPAAAQITTASLPTTSSVMPTGSASPIPAWAAFCRTYPGECAVDGRDAALIELTPRAWNSIVSVNRRVNASVRPLTDQEHWGVTDRWDLAETGSGDCEDYQLLKRKLLAEAGLPRRAMRMTVVIDEKGEGHAVLMLRTDRGDFILDNKTSTVLPWHQTGYVYVKREGQEGQAWVSLGGATSPSATANR